MYPQSWSALGVVLLVMGGAGTVLYVTSPTPEPESVVLMATTTVATTTEPEPIVQEKPSKRIEAQSVVPKTSVSVPVQVPVYAPPLINTYDEAWANLANDLVEQQKRAERQRKEDLEDMMEELQASQRPYFDCQEELEEIEAEIRADVQASGGMITESQVRAMAMKKSSCY